MQRNSIVHVWCKIVICFLIGFLLSHYLREAINALLYSQGISAEVKVIVSRFSVLGYVVPIFILGNRSLLKSEFLRVGNFQAKISFPFIWRGKEDPIWRFLAIFSIFVTLGSIFFINSFVNSLNIMDFKRILCFGIIFAIVNSVLEECVWRGYILSQHLEWSGNIQGLILTSFFFGLSHYDLGFPIWVCLAFAVGGFFIGGAAMKSRGIVASIIMHIFMNIIFVMTGMIFT